MNVDIKQVFLFQSQEFEIEEKTSTTIRFSSDGLSIFVKDGLLNPIYVAVYRWPSNNGVEFAKFAFETIKVNDSVLSKIHSNINILLDDYGFSFVPTIFFDANLPSLFLSQEVESALIEKEKVTYQIMNETTGISLINRDFFESYNSEKSNISVLSYMNALYNYSFQVKPLDKICQVFLSFTGSYFNILVKKFDKLLFVNRFEYSTKEDFIYFLIVALQNLEIANDDASIVLIGEIDPKSSLNEILCKYFSDVSFAKSSQEVSWDYHRYCVEQNY